MQDLNKNYIAGEWVSGASEIANINPSDLSDTVGMFAQASAAQLDDAIAAARIAQAAHQAAITRGFAGLGAQVRRATPATASTLTDERADLLSRFASITRPAPHRCARSVRPRPLTLALSW